MERLNYTIEGVDLKDFGITVSAVKGLLDIPNRKIAYKHSWNEISGEDVDLGIMANEVREIELYCQIKADSPAQAIISFNNFMSLVDGTQAKCLQIGLFDDGTLSGKFLSYLVYREDTVRLEKKFINGKVIWPFVIKLKEYLPYKRHFKFESTLEIMNLQLNIATLSKPIILVSGGIQHVIANTGLFELGFGTRGAWPVSIFSNSSNDYTYTINATLIWSMS